MIFGLLTATPVPIEVSNPVLRTATETDWALFSVTVLGTIASAAVAFFTYRLARQTRTLAGQTAHLAAESKRMADETASLATETLQSVNVARTGAQLADQHHQESQSPVIIMKDLRLIYNRAPSGVQIEMQLYGTTWNVGFGPALEVSITVTPDGGQPSDPFSVGTVGVGFFNRPGEYFPIRFASVPDLPQSPPATVTVAYRNIFGGSRRTTYHLGPRTGPDVPAIESETVSEQEVVRRTSAV